MATKLKTGDRVAYAARFLRSTGQFTGPGGQRRGTFVTYWDEGEKYARVRWDDFNFANMTAQFGYDYAADAKLKGQVVLAENIAKVGSPRFASNDI
jgi:hypothetical protein